MNKIAIIYISIHNGNTKKLLEGIANKCNIDLIKVTDADKVNLLEYDAVGFASGIYNGKFHKSIIKFIETNPSLPDKIFTVCTSGSGNKKYKVALNPLLIKHNNPASANYSCKGYDTYGLWKVIGGIAKGHPTQEDIDKGIEFIKNL